MTYRKGYEFIATRNVSHTHTDIVNDKSKGLQDLQTVRGYKMFKTVQLPVSFNNEHAVVTYNCHCQAA